MEAEESASAIGAAYEAQPRGGGEWIGEYSHILRRFVTLSPLYRAQHPHVCYAGSVIGAKGEVLIDLHFWTEADGFLIDYRCRTPRLPAAPHGVFLAAAYPDYHYQGKSITLKLEGCLAMEIACQPAFIQAAQQLLKQE
jgi:hypothetical protein